MKSIFGSHDEYRLSRILHVLEATFEYIIFTLMTGAYIAKLATYLGISDSVAGIISGIAQLGYAFQTVAIFLAGKRPVKWWVSLGHIMADIFFTLVYLCPFIKVDSTTRTILFFAFLIIGFISTNVVYPSKLNMYMVEVEPSIKGKYTAFKEAINLVGSMVFAYLVGFVMDAFEANGNIKGSFIFCGIAVFVLTIGHGLSLLFSKEKPEEETSTDTIKNLKNVFTNKEGMTIVVALIINNIFRAPIQSYVGTYQNNDLLFPMTHVAIVAAISSIARAVFSLPIADFGDKNSYKTEVMFCFGLDVVASLFLMFTNPSNGKIMFLIYSTLAAIANVGYCSGVIALIYETVGNKLGTAIYGLRTGLAGLFGFISTIVASFIVEYIQSNGNKLFGFNVYAQQVLALLGAIGIIVSMVIVQKCVKENDRHSVQK